MQSNKQAGLVASIVLVIVLVIALISTVAFGAWAYVGRQDYKNKVDEKIAKAVVEAKTAEDAKLKKQFDEESKLPNFTYKGPQAYGSVTFNYPKSWSAYVDETNSSKPIDGFFHPGVVPGKAAYGLRVELVSEDYAQVIQGFDSDVQQGTVKASAYIPPEMTKIPNVQTGTRFDGAIEQDIQGSMVVLKVRDKTLKIYTQATDFLSDFNNTILLHLTYVP